MEEVGFRKNVKGHMCTVNKLGQWWFSILKSKQWTWDHTGCDLRRDGVLLFTGIKALSDAVLLAVGWECCLSDIWNMSQASNRQLADAAGRHNPLGCVVLAIREGGRDAK